MSTETPSSVSDSTVVIRYLCTQMDELIKLVSQLNRTIEQHSKSVDRQRAEKISCVDFDRILHVCAYQFCVDPSRVMARDRHENVVLARQCIIWILNKQGHSAQSIEDKLNLSRGTARHGLNSFNAKLSTSMALSQKFRRIEQELEVVCG